MTTRPPRRGRAEKRGADRPVRYCYVGKAGWPAWAVCYPLPGYGYKCGLCMRGLITPKLRYRCRVCKATVRHIQYEPAALQRARGKR